MAQVTKKPVKTQPAQEVTENPVNLQKYERYTSLKFLHLSEAKMKDVDIAEMNDLETELKACSGSVPVRTVRAAIKNEICLMVKDVPVPKEIETIVLEAGDNSKLYYFGK